MPPLEPFVVESVSAERMRTLAALLRDPTPIHFAPEIVQRLGMGDRVINQGPANMGYVINALLAAAPDARIAKLQVRFEANVFAEDRVTAGGTIDDDGECDVWLDVDGGPRALEGRATLQRNG
jgi:acyl dehydratase